MSQLNKQRVLVTGGAGFLGRHLVDRLDSEQPAEVIVPRSAEYDLREPEVVRSLLAQTRPNVVVHLAASVGGIGANRENPGLYFYENAVMAIHLMEEARRIGVKKFVSIGTVCSYPKYTPVPFHEDELWNGYPEETNAPYGLAKKMLLVQGQAYRAQYGFNAITLFPVNLYGPGDNFDLRSSHVIPALIRKVVEARDSGASHIEVWGTGRASREFLFVRDAAEAIVTAAGSYDGEAPVNIGTGEEITIRDLVQLICELCSFTGEVRWDDTKPDGQPRRCLDTQRAKEEFGFEAATSFRDGLIETIAWYERNRHSIESSPAISVPKESVPAVAATPAPAAEPDCSGRRALITGITGQDGSYLAELLLSKGYEVHGLVRRASTFNTQRIDDLYVDPHKQDAQLFLHYGDLTDGQHITNLTLDIEPDEIYNLGAQSHVRVSFDQPAYTLQATGAGALNVLEAARQLNKRREVRVYQASSSEMYGDVAEVPQTERTVFRPQSPYAAAKVYAFHQTVNYRQAYDLFATNGILFNHESPRRGETFVTRKITRAAARIKCGLQDRLYLGNLDAKRDWGFARDYVEAMWLMLQHREPDDFVVATGETHTVHEFLQLAFAELDLVPEEFVKIDPRYFRPTEVNLLLGDASKAKEVLGWEPRTSFRELVQLMVAQDFEAERRAAMVASSTGGSSTSRSHEFSKAV